MRYSLFNFATVMMVFLGSCKKPVTVPQQHVKYLSKISSSPTDLRSFTYDSEKRLANHTLQFDNGNGMSFMSVDYSYLNGTISTATSQGGSVVYETEGQQVKAIRSFRPNGTPIAVMNYSYTNRGQLTEWKEAFIQPAVDQPKETKQLFEYYADGNVKQMKYYVKLTTDGEFVLNGTTLYDQYDQFKNPEIAFPGAVYLPAIVFQKNNVGRIRHYAATGELYQTSTFQYTYDAEGYPATKLFKDERSTIDVLFTYHY